VRGRVRSFSVIHHDQKQALIDRRFLIREQILICLSGKLGIFGQFGVKVYVRTLRYYLTH
jgi:hypothetical protein